MLDEITTDKAICNTCLTKVDIVKLIEVRNCFGFPMLQCSMCFEGIHNKETTPEAAALIATRGM